MVINGFLAIFRTFDVHILEITCFFQMKPLQKKDPKWRAWVHQYDWMWSEWWAFKMARNLWAFYVVDTLTDRYPLSQSCTKHVLRFGTPGSKLSLSHLKSQKKPASKNANCRKAKCPIFKAIVAGFRSKVAFKKKTLGVPGRSSENHGHPNGHPKFNTSISG